MFAHRTAAGLTIALLALPATAIAKPTPDSSGGGDATPAPSSSRPYSDYYGWGTVPSNHDGRGDAPTSSLAGTTTQHLISPDASDAARAGEIAQAMEHYQRSQPATTAVPKAAPAKLDDDTPAWPEIAFAGVVLLATAGGVVRVRARRTRRVAA